MITRHQIVLKNSNQMKALSDESVDLVVTSPPYPMIEMWDRLFADQNKAVREVLGQQDGIAAFEGMHRTLDAVWQQLFRVLKKGGIACINIGDATRTIDDHFRLYTNHVRILSTMQHLGFSTLPAIVWRKQTNAPNKFMGSGMMPPGAYVTLEHEYILILRKGNKREFKSPKDKQNRRQSAYFWEERNTWFSDVWMDLKGTTQRLFDNRSRSRSGAFPFELPYRLISMFSVKGDTVLDPFLGVGTTMAAAIAAGRNSIGYEIDPDLRAVMLPDLRHVVDVANARIHDRLHRHVAFVKERIAAKGHFKHINRHYGFPVMTRQETDLILNPLTAVTSVGDNDFKAIHGDEPQGMFANNWEDCVPIRAEATAAKNLAAGKRSSAKSKQRSLF